MKIINTEKLPIKMWLEEIEPEALQQAKNLANLPFAFRHIAIMPDSHSGYGMPIGGVLATDNVVVPNAVGVDIGCGMCAVKTSLTEISQDELKRIMGEIRKVIPVGFAHQSTKQDESLMPKQSVAQLARAGGLDPSGWRFESSHSDLIIEKEYQNALTQIGTLGGGNHFIEIQKGSDGHIWIMIHSGSRNLGYKVAEYYNDLASKLNSRWYTSIDKSAELAFLPVDTEEGQNYLREMQYCVDFALANRQLIMKRICDIFKQITDCEFIDMGGYGGMINIAHNYASLENHFGKNVVVHRKGATKATKGLTGIIPGSMGTKSYIVEGLGNKESFESCSHGSGRLMSRTKAIETLNLEEEQKKMEGIIGAPRSKQDLEEAPGAYKPIEEVMHNQSDLVKILVELHPLAVIKGYQL